MSQKRWTKGSNHRFRKKQRDESDDETNLRAKLKQDSDFRVLNTNNEHQFCYWIVGFPSTRTNQTTWRVIPILLNKIMEEIISNEFTQIQIPTKRYPFVLFFQSSSSFLPLSFFLSPLPPALFLSKFAAEIWGKV